MILLKTFEQIEYLKKSNKVVGDVLRLLKKEAKEGVTTFDLDRMAETSILENGCIPAFKGYQGFPFTICASKNNHVVHGFPDKTPLQPGDILSIDVGACYNGFYGDAAITVEIGEVPQNVSLLLKTTEYALHKAISRAIPGNRLFDISYVIQDIAEDAGFFVIKTHGGHGVGKRLHEMPKVPNYGRANSGPVLKPRMVIAVEPIVVEKDNNLKLLENKWTYATRDGKMSAHFEHTILITDNGPEILSI